MLPLAGVKVVEVAQNHRLFAKLCAALDHPEWAGDPRFVTNRERQVDGERPPMRRAPPRVGEHNAEILGPRAS